MSDADIDVASMKVADLRRELKARGLASTGNKSELVDRLQMAVVAAQDDVDKLLEDKPSVAVANADEANEEEPATKELGKRRVAINRSVELPTMTEEATDTTSSPVTEVTTTTLVTATPSLATETTTSTTAASSKSVLSDHDRALARAARFGVQNESLKKMSRAERFGIKDDKTIGLSAPKADVDTLRRRAERFGQTTSKAMQSVEEEERIRKRKERFGSNSGQPSDEQLKKRRERFGLITA